MSDQAPENAVIAERFVNFQHFLNGKLKLLQVQVEEEYRSSLYAASTACASRHSFSCELVKQGRTTCNLTQVEASGVLGAIQPTLSITRSAPYKEEPDIDLDSGFFEARSPGSQASWSSDDVDAMQNTMFLQDTESMSNWRRLLTAVSQSLEVDLSRTSGRENGLSRLVSNAEISELRDAVHKNLTSLEMKPIWRDFQTSERATSDPWTRLLHAHTAAKHRARSSLVSTVSSDRKRQSLDSRRSSESSLMIPSSTRMRVKMIHPDSWGYATWVLCGALFIIYEALAIPVELFFRSDDAEPFALVVFSWGMSIYWTVAIPLEFMVGFHGQGFYPELRPAKVAVHYSKTWLMPDTLAVVMEWMYLILAEVAKDGGSADKVSATASLMRATRVLSLFRAVRLVRIFKLKSMVSRFEDTCSSDLIVAICKIVRLMVMIICIHHYIACMWYWIGSASRDVGMNWIEYEGLEDSSDGDCYASALHWALTQSTPATTNVFPHNTEERVYAICIVIFALVSFSSFVSSVTAAMTQLRTLNEDRNKEEGRIRDFIFANKISHRLGKVIWQTFRKKWAGKTRTTLEADLNLLKHLPESLAMELHAEMYVLTLLLHPLFGVCNIADKAIIRQLCHLAMSQVIHSPFEDLFIEGKPGDVMMFVSHGSLQYECLLLENQAVQVLQDDWISEAALWVANWLHRGRLRTNVQCELACLSAAKFVESCEQMEEDLLSCFRAYAQKFLDFFKEKEINCLDVLVDEGSDCFLKEIFIQERIPNVCFERYLPPQEHAEALRAAQTQKRVGRWNEATGRGSIIRR